MKPAALLITIATATAASAQMTMKTTLNLVKWARER